MVQKAGKIFLFTAFCLYSKLKSIIIIHVLRNYQIFKYFTNIKILNIHKGFFRTPKILPSNKQRSNTDLSMLNHLMKISLIEVVIIKTFKHYFRLVFQVSLV